MELWIRSQNRERLVCARGFELQKVYENICQIFSRDNNNYEVLGIYKSKKRAIEILDELNNLLIQNSNRVLLKPKSIVRPEFLKDLKEYIEQLNNMNYEIVIPELEVVSNTSNLLIYEMPKDEEVVV